MTETEQQREYAAEMAAPQPQAPPVWVSALAWSVRAVAQIWVLTLLLFAAAAAGIGAYKTFEVRQELQELRSAPGPQPYAVVAYRRELARQIREYGRNWDDPNAVPPPPQRVRLMAEIDVARQRNQDLRRAGVSGPPLVAPQ